MDVGTGMTEKELFEEMKAMTLIEIHSDNLIEIIQSRERKAFAAGAYSRCGYYDDKEPFEPKFKEYLESQEYLKDE